MSKYDDTEGDAKVTNLSNLTGLSENVILSIISGIGATLITFMLSTILSLYLSVRETKKTNRAFISLDELELRCDGYPLTKDNPVKVLETKDYTTLMREEKGHKPNVGFARIKNLGPGAAIELKIEFRLIMADSDDESEGWRIHVNVPLLEKDGMLLVPLLKYEHKGRYFYITDADISYKTQVNERMRKVYRAKKDKENREQLNITEELEFRHFFLYRKIFKYEINSSQWMIFYENEK